MIRISFYLDIIKLYLLLNKNALLTLKNFRKSIDEAYYIKPLKKMVTKEFNYIYFPKNETKKNGCPLCFNNIYTNKWLKLLPLKLKDRFFYLMPSHKEYVPLHFVLVDFVHTKMSIEKETITYFIAFNKLFPDLTICTNCDLPFIGGSVSKHLHYQVGLMEMPLFKCDATHLQDNIYKLNWYMTVYLIKDTNLETLKASYLKLFTSFHNDTHSFNIVLRKKHDTYYLYLILRTIENIKRLDEFNEFKKGIGVFEAMGHFILEENNYTLEEIISLSKKILMASS